MRLSLRSIRGASGSYHQGSAGGRDQHAEHRNPGQDKPLSDKYRSSFKNFDFS
jgi:hypothetical protein